LRIYQNSRKLSRREESVIISPEVSREEQFYGDIDGDRRVRESIEFERDRDLLKEILAITENPKALTG